MKPLRIAVLGAFLLVGGAISASAQAPEGRRGGNPALNGIELTDAQKAKFEEIQKKYQPEMLAAREAAATDRAEAMKKFMSIRERQSAELRAVLTPAQQAVFDKRMEELRARSEQMMRQPPPPSE